MSDLSFKIKTPILIALTFVVAMFLSILPYPHWFIWLQPSWVALLMITWTLIMPNKVGVGVAWLMGIWLDVLLNLPLGANALTLVIVAYLTIKFQNKIKPLYLWQKTAIVFGLILFYQIGLCALQSILGYSCWVWISISQAVVSTIVWPVVVVFILYYHRRYDLENTYS